jgi:hypothetical protein
MTEIDERSLKILARFAVEVMAASERRAPPAAPHNWLRWFAEANGIDLENPPFMDGRHLKKKAAGHDTRPIG